MRKFALLTISFFILLNTHAQDSLQARIVLIGDAGELTNGQHPVVRAVSRNVPHDGKTTILYLGDNLYKTGLPDNSLPTYEIAKAPLDSQIHVAPGNKTRVYFVPGNHDWANGGDNGFESILRVQDYIDLLSNNYVTMLPRDGCPGPVEVKINDDVTVVIMDSQWWLHENDKPGIESDCEFKTESEILLQLDDILSKNSSKLVILAMHHPFKSNGPHGGYFTLKQHIFPFTDWKPNLYIPLPLIGSAYPLTRAVFGTIQDIKHPTYQHMKSSIDDVIKSYKNIIHVSGHEHTLQYIVDSSRYYIVSGAGSQDPNRVSVAKNTKYAASKVGYAVLEVSKNKNVTVKFYLVNGDEVKESYAGHVIDFSKLPVESADTMRIVEAAFKDSVVISASDKYKNWSGFKKIVLGSNYREEWNKPVALKVFNLRKEKGGLEIKSLGGGKQTKSLKLEDKNGKEWTLRTVDKDPEKALPSNLRGTLAQGIVQDMISASHPYAPLIVPDLAYAVGIIAARPQFFFVPDDPAFGQYRELFANSVCMLEDRDPTITSKEEDDSKSTGKIMNKMLEDNEHHVDQQKVLNARLLDMLIADFDRHADQWKWGTDDTGKGKLYYPIPRDRDQALFKSNGLLVNYLNNSKMPFLEGFESSIGDINGLNYVAKDFDRIFLNNLDEKAWDSIIRKFQSQMTDDVIEKAVSKLPPEIYSIRSEKIISSLRHRREELLKEGMKYYRFLTKRVNITGSNKPEYFHVKPHEKGIELTVYKKSDKTDSSTIMYNRVFYDKDTKEIALYGLNGDDKFEIARNVRSGIKIRIIGGKGSDTFDLKGNALNFLYDLKTEKNAVINARRTNREFKTDASVISYKTTGFEYNSFSFPQLKLGYNPEDGFMFGVGFSARTHGFRKEPYATNQQFSSLFAPLRKAYQLRYNGEFNHVISKNDLVVNAEYVNPTLNNFFGLGNETKFNDTLPVSYYRVRYKYLTGDLMIRKRLNEILSFSAGPSYYRYWSDYEDNKSRILSNPALIGRDSLNIYSLKQYFGARANINIRYINNEQNPTRGITWFTDFITLRGFTESAQAFTRLSSDMTIYASVSTRSRINAVMRFGAGHIFSKDFEYFQALSIGANNYLRGFRKNRFSGRSIAYGSAEARMRLFTSHSYILPGDVGLVGFYDLGRVWQKTETSKKWHDSYGGGLYYVPFNLLMISATVGISEEDRLFNFTLGTRFNLTF